MEQQRGTRVAILCGGLGIRLAELTEQIPKGMIPVGERPILWHIMKYFASFGHIHFVLLVGYKAEKFVAYFEEHGEPGWDVAFVNSGEAATKSQRLLDARASLGGAPFFLAYGDDLSDVDLDAVAARNEKSGAVVTLTAVRSTSPFGIVRIADSGAIKSFEEKIELDDWINGGYMRVQPRIFDFLARGELETHVLPALASEGLIDAHQHEGFWMSMNTLKESQELGRIWRSGDVPWRRWSE